MFTKVAATTLAVAVIATSAMTVSVQTADAKNGRNGAFAAGAVIGLATGAIVGSQYQRRYYAPPPPAYYPAPAPVYYAHPEPWTPAWYRYCSSKYRSFNPNTGYFVTYSGYRKFCR
ncbi:BA14K family protein [Labrenzia aggregata]|uniref:Lectin-like protein BA14k n=2 Tax=Roseibium aggregatum TaxID=187304 RepID=A0A926NYS3_9HYPH|nr:BA14K family protein [Roseibium aggregatum]